jgi:hypothetical protein
MVEAAFVPYMSTVESPNNAEAPHTLSIMKLTLSADRSEMTPSMMIMTLPLLVVHQEQVEGSHFGKGPLEPRD